MTLNIFCDGGCIVGKGIGAISYVIVKDNVIVEMKSTLVNGLAITNNQCEYKAIIEALVDRKCDAIYSDSEIVIKQITGEYEVKDSRLKVLHGLVMDLVEDSNILFFNVPRTNKYIQIADKLNKITMNEAKNV